MVAIKGIHRWPLSFTILILLLHRQNYRFLITKYKFCRHRIYILFFNFETLDTSDDICDGINELINMMLVLLIIYAFNTFHTIDCSFLFI